MEKEGQDMVADTFLIQRAHPEELNEVVAVDQQLWGAWANPITLYRQLLELFPTTILTARHESGTYAGCVIGLVRPDSTCGWVLSIDIDPQFQGKRLGTRLLTEVIVAFQNLNLGRVEAIIDPLNMSSKRLFAANGFQQISLEEDYFEPGKQQERWARSLRPQS